MGKKAKQKGRKKDRRDSAGLSGAAAERWGGRPHLAPELWLDAEAPGGTTPGGTTPAEPAPIVAVPVRAERQPAAAATSSVGAVRPSVPVRRSGSSVDATELAARLAGLGTVLQRQLARTDVGEGLTRARLSVLALLVLGGPRRLGELAAAERVRPPTMTRLVHAMEADGWVERSPDPADRRSIIIRATPAGEAQLEQGRMQQLAPLAEAIGVLGTPDRHVLDEAVALLERLLRVGGWPSGPAGA
jgi:DNA-binding MarR family transcriptional regulator